MFRIDEVYDEDGLNNVELDESVAVCISDSDICEQLEFYRSVISPFIESYWVTATCLTTLIQQTLQYDHFLSQTIELAKDNLRKGFLLYRKFSAHFRRIYKMIFPLLTEESISLEPIKNCLSLFQNQGIIKKEMVNGCLVVSLTEKYDNESALNQVIINIEKFKK